ncbi:MAG: IS701 family transposase, partial [Anaerolineae bacterium]
ILKGMKKTLRIPQAPSGPIPELTEFLARFQVHFKRTESEIAAERYLTGLLTEHPNKNCDTLAEIVPGTSAQSLQGLLTSMVWDEEDLNRQRVQVMAALPTEGDGVMIFDDTGFAKQGKDSVGVKRQYSGTLGKVANCQVTVNCTYAERTLAWPVATRLYLPKEWATDAGRRQKAHIPDTIPFQTKAEIALELLDQANTWGVRHRCVAADADYGDNPHFLDGLEQRHARYVVAVRANFQVSLARGAAATVEAAHAVIQRQRPNQWTTIRWKEGPTGWLRARFTAIRCWRVDGHGIRRVGWLIGQCPVRGETGDWKYVWSNFPPQTPLAKMAEYFHRRHWVEQFHEEAKGELGWDQYQGRLWHGFHRHAILTLLTYSFLVWREWQERQNRPRRGRPRGAFSPSAGSASHHLAAAPSPIG